MAQNCPFEFTKCFRLSIPWILILGLTLGKAQAESSSHATRPNIVFIMSDDHAAHAISAYGSRVNNTPHIDRIAAEGIRFQNCFATNSICTPSRAAILTGKYSHINGVPVFNRFDGSQATLPKYLLDSGYHTGIVGKWHLGSDPTGFTFWSILPGQGRYHDPDFIEMGQRVSKQGYVTSIITDMAIDFLDKRPAESPFFLMVHHKAPHREWEPPAELVEKWKDREIPEPDTFHDDYRTRSTAASEARMRIDADLTRRDLKYPVPPPDLRGQELQAWMSKVDKELEVEVGGKTVRLVGTELKKWKYQRYMRDYLACVESIDTNVGRLLSYLEEHELAENTLVIYTSDQGFFLGDHNWYDKRFMYEESLRMPLLMRWPAKIKAGSVSSAIVLNVDFAPTLLNAAGIERPGDMQGESFLAALRGEGLVGWRESMYYRYYHYPQDHNVQPHYGVRTERFKLIYFPQLDAWELYDLLNDPHELQNLAGEPDHKRTLDDLKQELERLRTQLGDKDQFADNLPPYGV
jgi:arylsulfatase A-like enzyme